MRIVVAGGGSGGHITPILAVAWALKSHDREIHYVGLGQRRERELVEPSGAHLHRIYAGKFRRYHQRSWRSRLSDWRTPVLNLLDGARFFIGLIQSLWLLWRIKPEKVFIKGGYVGLPVGVAAKLLRIPFMIHESDSVPGLANRILGKLTPYRVSGFDIPGYRNLGNPVRSEVLNGNAGDRGDFGITTKKPIVLAFGGSLGSNALNTAITGLANITDRYEVIHVRGDRAGEVDSEMAHYHPYPFLSEKMPNALHLADVVIARSGANTLAELAALKKASIIIPHPNLSGNHQFKNAQAMADAEAAVLLEQASLSPEVLLREIDALMEDTEFREQMQQRISRFARRDSAEEIAQYLLSIGEEGSEGRT